MSSGRVSRCRSLLGCFQLWTLGVLHYMRRLLQSLLGCFQLGTLGVLHCLLQSLHSLLWIAVWIGQIWQIHWIALQSLSDSRVQAPVSAANVWPAD